MKIPRLSGIKAGLGIATVATTLTLSAFSSPKTNTNTLQNSTDTFEYLEKTPTQPPSMKSKVARWVTKTFSDAIVLPPPSGSNSDEVLAFAPSPEVRVKGQKKIVTFVVDVTNNVLYHYDKSGNPIMAYLVASGKNTREDRTDEGLKVVSHVETYPYRTAPAQTKRRKNPRDYGPRCIILNTLDPQTGKKGVTGEFIHGNRDVSSLGKHASKGCIRMDNGVIKKLANIVKRNDLVLVIRRAL